MEFVKMDLVWICFIGHGRATCGFMIQATKKTPGQWSSDGQRVVSGAKKYNDSGGTGSSVTNNFLGIFQSSSRMM